MNRQGQTGPNISKPVESLLPDWQMKLDSDLIVYLIGQGFKINAYAEEDLAGALYDDRRDTEKVQGCLAYLIANGICEMNSEYALRLVPPARGLHAN